MTSDYLLDAIGFIDDDLIQDADALPAPTLFSTARKWANRWGPLAACMVLVLTLGYGVTQLGHGGSDSTASTSAATGSTGTVMEDNSTTGAAEPSTGNSTEMDGSQTTTSDPHFPTATEPVTGTLYLYTEQSTLTYALSGQVTDELPQDCRSLGTLTQVSDSGDQQAHATDVEDYVGCSLWAAEDDTSPAILYVQLPDGQYAVAELVQP